MGSNAGNWKWAAVILPIVAVPAFLFYATHRGAERAAPSAPPAPTAADHGSAGLDTALARLENRLRGGGGSKADWDLLAKTYDFLGRKADAANARNAHQVAPPSGAANAAGAQPGGPWSADVVADFMRFGGRTAGEGAAGGAPDAPSTRTAPPSDVPPSDAVQRRVDDLLNAADRARSAQDFSAATSDYEQVVALGRMSAQSWADYADVAASLNGGHWNAAAQRYIEAALKLDPTNQKALWLLGSAQHAEGHYAPAAATWNRLLALTPADAPEAAIFNANLAEDQHLAGGAAAASGGAAAAPVGAAAARGSVGQLQVEGQVALDAALEGKVPAGLTLFIIARAVNSPGAPVAVARLATGRWPMPFTLDDSLAMLPARKLSTAGIVAVQARISRSGAAAGQAGDWQSAPVTVDPRTSKTIRLIIDRIIG